MCGEAPAGFELRLKFRNTIGARICELLVWVEIKRIGGCVEGVWTVDKGCAKRNGRCIFDLEKEVGRRGEDSVMGWRVCNCISDYLADFNAAALVEEKHIWGSRVEG